MVDSIVMQSGRYKAYPKYKDSGVEWLGGIPIDWKFSKLKRTCSVKGGYAFKSELFSDSGIPVIRIGDIHRDGSIDLSGCKYIPIVSPLVHKEYSVTNGQILMAMTGATIGKAGRYSNLESALINQRVGKFELNNQNILYSFLWYILQTDGYQNYIKLTAFGGAQPNISDVEMVDLHVTIPTKEEQESIANFLDHETAKIDTLIEKQQRLIELLIEKRQAVISHAVTKGLNPDVPMKDSGVEWLGEVPEHWQVSKAKYVSNVFVPQRNKPELNDTKGLPWITMEDMKTDYITDAYRFVTLNALKHSGSRVLQAGAVIASCVGNFGVTSINKVDVIINQQLQAFIPLNIKAEYLKAIVSLSKEYFELIGTSATLVYVNKEGFENLPILIPTPKEQSAICEFINKEIQRFNKLISKAEHAIQLMQERRTALVSAAVTGKIDVRDWVKPE